MPGNEHGDRVHNFFAQDNSSQSHVPEGNWVMPNNNIWVGSQRHVDVLNPSKTFSGQNSEIDRGRSSYPVHAAHGLNFPQSSPRPDFSRNQSLNEQQYSNGYMYGHQVSQSRQTEANFRESDTYSDQRHLLASRGYELQRVSSHEQQPKASDRSETSVAPASFDLFGGQRQMNHQQASMLQALQRQQSGPTDMQQLQQQLMIRKMEELQRQQQLQQLDLRPQNLINGTPSSDGSCNTWTAEPGANWLGRGSSDMQGPSSGITFLPDLGQTHQLMDVTHQQVDQSLYGVPVSNSRGLAINQYFPMVTERSSVPQMPTSTKSLQSNQPNRLPDRLTGQEGTSLSRQNFQNETNEYASSQKPNAGIMHMGFHQQVNSLEHNATQQELATLSETSQERFTMQVSSPQNEVTLDPAEEKILYGSDDNIWSAFGKLPNVSGESGNLFESTGIPNGFTSIQSGTWSALMQSAVAETSSADVGPQEGWSGLNFHNSDGYSADQPPLIHNENVKQASLPIDGRIPSATGTQSIRSSNINTLSPMGLNQLGHTFQRESNESVSADSSQRFGQSSAGTSKWLNHRQMQNSLANDGQIHGNALGNALVAEENGKTVSADWPPGQSGTRPQPNGWNAPVALPPTGDRAPNILDTQNSDKVRVIQGQMVDDGSLWKSSSHTSAAESGTVRSMTGNQQAKRSEGNMNLHDATSSVASSCNMIAGDGANPFAQNSYFINQWKHASSTKSQGGEGFGRMMNQVHNQNQASSKGSDKYAASDYDRENCATKESSNDSQHSNLSNHALGGFRETGIVDATDSRSLSSGKQKSNNQLAKKNSAPRKFQYHPMGNLDDDVGPTHGLKQPIPLQNAHSGQLKLFGQVQRNPTEKDEHTKDTKHLNKEPSCGMSNLFSRSCDSSTNKPSPSSQNMLELLHKVDQSRDDSSLMHLSSFERNVSSQPSEAEKSNGSAGRAQRRQSSLSQGFGLQLGPPSQLLQNPDLSSPSHNAQCMGNATRSGHIGTAVEEKGMLKASSLQPRQFPGEKSEMQHEKSQIQNENDNPVSKVSGNYNSAFTSDTPHVRRHLQNKQVTNISARAATNQHIDTSSGYGNSHSMVKGSTETVLPDASGNLQKNKPPSSGGTVQQSDFQHFGLPGISRQVLHNTWTNVPTPQHLKGQAHFHEQNQPNILESSSRGDLDAGKAGYISSKSTAYHADSVVGVDGQEHRLKENTGQLSSSKIEVSPGNASSIKNHVDESTANSASTQTDIEKFGRSLKPNAFSNEKFALLNQMRDAKNAESAPSIRFSKRIKGPENVHDVHQAHSIAEKLNQDDFSNSGSSSGVDPDDSRVVSFSTSDTFQRNTFLHGNADTEHVAATTGLHDSPSKPSADGTTVAVKHHMVNPHMAPSWFNQYGSFKNDQLLPLQNVRHVISSSSSVMDTPYLEDKTTATPDEAYQVSGPLQSSAPIVEANQQLSSLSLQMDVASQNQVISRPKKRKTATSELLSWYKEIAHCSQSPSILSVVEADWSKAANRLTEKVEDDVDLIEDGGPQILRSKRRLILTTQLMQQLFYPPPATLLSADASSEYETVAYAVSRVALGDACSALSTSSNLGLPGDGIDLHAVKGKLIRDPSFAKVVEDLFRKVTKLESCFSRLDKRASILDLRLERQDLEKFSVINRFAKFHGRAQNDNAETSSTNTTSVAPKPCAQRYINAVPMPRSLPDVVQCLSL